MKIDVDQRHIIHLHVTRPFMFSQWYNVMKAIISLYHLQLQCILLFISLHVASGLFVTLQEKFGMIKNVDNVSHHTDTI